MQLHASPDAALLTEGRCTSGTRAVLAAVLAGMRVRSGFTPTDLENVRPEDMTSRYVRIRQA